MTTFYVDKILQGSALDKLKELPNEYVDCIITSPPYWSLRDYKVDGQIGVEKTIDEYIHNLISIFNECKRVLKKEGTCWVVISDTYASSGGKQIEDGFNRRRSRITNKEIDYSPKSKLRKTLGKSLLLIPERFAIEMINNQWILRNKIIWHKRNCMPSSAKDRFTIDYEFIYFFSKSQKYYFKTQYEQFTEQTQQRWQRYKNNNNIVNNKPWKSYASNHVQIPTEITKRTLKAMTQNNGRIKRCVWTINPRPFKDAHFAVFPEELVKQCMDAGCPDNGIILDPFLGSGTTALVAVRNNRHFVGIELNKDYVSMAQKRLDPYLKQQKLI